MSVVVSRNIGYLGTCFLRQQARPLDVDLRRRATRIYPPAAPLPRPSPGRQRHPISRFLYIYSVTASTAQTGGCLDLSRTNLPTTSPSLLSASTFRFFFRFPFVIGEGIPWVIHFFVHLSIYSLFFSFLVVLKGVVIGLFEAINLMEYSLYSFLPSLFVFSYI